MLRDLGGLLLKLFGLSALISVAIKGVGPQLPLPGTALVAGLIVALPPLIVALWLWWAGRRVEL